MKRPTFFISSTIYDFQDLRSSLKFYLENQGCKVLASEFNDFTKPLDKHSYEACLSSIHDADYFILLIGSRVGGWYDEKERISITQREYREAYKLQKSGKLKLLNFVRSSVWQVREDRHELSKFLRDLEIATETSKKIANYTGKFASDAEFISNFISEVGRNHETKLAVKYGEDAPVGNWLHVFANFKEIIDVLQGQLFLSTPIEDLTSRRLLRRELRDVIKLCLLKLNKGNVISPKCHVDNFHEKCPLSFESRKQEYISVEIKQWRILSSLGFRLLNLRLHTVVLPQVLSSATFLKFNVTSDSYEETPVYEALHSLNNEVRRFNRENTKETLGILFEYSPKYHPHHGSSIDIEFIKLASYLHLLDRWVNVIELSRSLLRYLEGSGFELPLLRPDSPVQGMQEQLDQERLTELDVDEFVKFG